MVSNAQKTKTSCLLLGALMLGACSSGPKQEAAVAKPTTVITGPGSSVASQTTSSPARSSVVAAAPVATPTPPAPAPAAPPVASAPSASPAPALAQPVASSLKAETGLYRCEEKQTVAVKRVIDGGKKIVIGFAGKDHELSNVVSDTGALRFENKQAGYTWIQLANTALLLDTKKGQRVANQCKL
jgi:membrane-bound inhibitor of C-type lysozyme